MKQSKIHFIKLIACLVLLSFGCSKDEPEAPNLEKPKPVGSKEINVLIEGSLDFRNYRANTIMDSTAVDNPDEKLYAPEKMSSTVFFTDKVTGEIMAMALLDSASSEVRVNSAAVTDAVVTMAPMYTALSTQQRKDLLLEIKNEPSYDQLKATVTDILSKREPIFSARPEFIKQLLEVNAYIMGAYFPGLRLQSGRITVGKEDFPSFVVKDDGMTVVNQVFSHVYIEFSPISGGSSVSRILDARSISDSGKGKINRASLGLNDNCYNVVINQSDPAAITKNTVQLGTILTSAFLEAVIGIGIKGCAPELTAKIATELGITLAGASDLPPNELLGEATKAVLEVVLEAIKDGDCALLTNKAVIAKAVASKANLYGNLYKAAEFIVNASPAGPYALSLIPGSRVDLSEIIQLYQGNLVEACVKVTKDVTLKPEYQTEEKLTISIKIDPQSQYGEWKKSGFKVNWALPPMNGSLSSASLETSSDGTASVIWTLPKEANAVVTLSAELKDKEGDHLTGSPLNFQLKVNKADSLAYYNLILRGQWKDVGAVDPIHTFFENFSGKYYGDNTSWRVEKNSSYKSISGSDYILLIRHWGTRRTYLYAIKENNSLLFLNAFLDYNW